MFKEGQLGDAENNVKDFPLPRLIWFEHRSKQFQQ